VFCTIFILTLYELCVCVRVCVLSDELLAMIPGLMKELSEVEIEYKGKGGKAGGPSNKGQRGKGAGVPARPRSADRKKPAPAKVDRAGKPPPAKTNTKKPGKGETGCVVGLLSNPVRIGSKLELSYNNVQKLISGYFRLRGHCNCVVMRNDRL
jgi:hypothetical protein